MLTAGVVPVSSLSSVAGHADTTSLAIIAKSEMSLGLRPRVATVLRLTWKHPTQASTATDVSRSNPSGAPLYDTANLCVRGCGADTERQLPIIGCI